MTTYHSASRKIVVRENALLARKRGVSTPAEENRAPVYLPISQFMETVAAWIRACEVQQMSSKTINQRKDFLGKLYWQLTECQQAKHVTPETIEEFLIYVGKRLLPVESRWDSDNPRAKLPVSPRPSRTSIGFHE